MMQNIWATDFNDTDNVFLVPVGVSNRHLHVSAADLAALFGPDYKLTHKKDLSQPGQFASEEVVTLRGPKGELKNVRILGPERPETQVEISQTDARTLGLTAPMRESGKVEGSSTITIIGPAGTVELAEGCIIALTHIHLSDVEGAEMGIEDKQLVDVYFNGDGKRGALFGVLARVGKQYAKELHVDIDEANAFRVGNSSRALVVVPEK